MTRPTDLPHPLARSLLSAWTAMASAADLTFAQACYVNAGKLARKRIKAEGKRAEGEADAAFSAARMVEREQRFRASGAWTEAEPTDNSINPDEEAH